MKAKTAASGETAIESVDTVVIGAGQAGLAVSYFLTQRNHSHVVLEQDRIGSSWAKQRWDSFTLVTPNWMNRLPGFPYRGLEPDGFSSRDDVVAYLERYAASFGAPIRLGVRVKHVTRRPTENEYQVTTDQGPITAKNVVVTTGYFHRPKRPRFAEKISRSVQQLSSADYKNPGALDDGAVLVVGSGQSGCQIAEELHDAGRSVFLAVGDAPREPRRYRGRDINHWLDRMGAFDRGFADPSNPVERYQANPHCSGARGGHAINLRDLAARGITLLGRIVDARGDELTLASDLRENLVKADNASFELMRAVDDYVAATGLDVPLPDDMNTDDGTPRNRGQIRDLGCLDLAESGVATIFWATGFACDFSWIDLPILDRHGYPIQNRGVTPHPGLYFCGLHWMTNMKSGLLFGVGEAAQHVTDHLLDRERRGLTGPAITDAPAVHPAPNASRRTW